MLIKTSEIKINMDYTKERNNLIDAFDACKMSLQNALSGEVIFKLGAEIEFYLIDRQNNFYDFENIKAPLGIEAQNYLQYKYTDEKIQSFGLKLKHEMKKHEIEISDIEKEDGKNQFEIEINPLNHPVLIADAIAKFRKYALLIAKEEGLYFIYCGKPFENDAGNAMQINISLLSNKGVNIFQHKDRFSQLINYAIGGLMKHMSELIYLCCVDSDNSYFKYQRPKIGSLHINYPTNVSWGINNRTCAIRVPFSKSMNMQDARIEFRPGTLCANPYNLICGLVYCITAGICNAIEPAEQIYYNAFDKRYNDLTELPKAQSDAIKLYYGKKIHSIIDGEIHNHIKIALIGS